MKRLILLLLCLIVGACSSNQEAAIDTPVVANTPNPVAQASDPSPTIIQEPTETLVLPSATATPTLPPSATPTIPIVVTATPNAVAGASPTPIEPEEAPMVVVPAGEFLMGSTFGQVYTFEEQWGDYLDGLSRCSSSGCRRDAFIDELYQFTVYLEEFEIDQFEVTNYQYRACVEAGVCSNPNDLDSLYLPKFANYPVTNLTQEQAATYCEWVGRRLPSEAEWEKAARGTDGRIYPWGNEWDEQHLNIGPELESVGIHPTGASPYGAFDMLGNAAEWTSSLLAPNPGQQFAEAHELPVDKPVFRGGMILGSPYLPEVQLRSAIRNDFRLREPSGILLLPQIGFRCVRGTQQETTILSSTAPQPLPTATAVDYTDMVLIPAGEFTMGIDNPVKSMEQSASPAHLVYLDAFYIDQYEVTVAQYIIFLNAYGQHKSACQGSDCLDIEWYHSRVELQDGIYQAKEGDEFLPIEVSWYGAEAYCAWQNKRLPTEAEWEKAARGTDSRKYPWGNEDKPSNAVGYWEKPSPVGSHPIDVSPYGVFDMLGNAREWTADWSEPNYYAHSPAENPTGAQQPNVYYEKEVRSGVYPPASIIRRHIANVLRSIGFRCVATP